MIWNHVDIHFWKVIKFIWAHTTIYVLKLLQSSIQHIVLWVKPMFKSCFHYKYLWPPCILLFYSFRKKRGTILLYGYVHTHVNYNYFNIGMCMLPANSILDIHYMSYLWINSQESIEFKNQNVFLLCTSLLLLSTMEHLGGSLSCTWE